VIKLGRLLFIVEKNEGRRRRNRGGEEDGCSPGHKLNIVDRFTDGLMPLVIMSVKMTCHHTFLHFFSFFFTVILLIYIKRIIMLVVTDEHSGK
jgi:hypothetical protein